MLFAHGALLGLMHSAGSGRPAFLIGWWFGLGQFCAGLYWIAIAFQYQQNMPAALGAVAVILLSGFLALYSGLACLIAARLSAGPISRAVWLAAAMTLTEMLRGLLFTGFPWNSVGAIWANWPAMAQSAASIGVHGLTLVTLLLFGLAASARDWRLPMTLALLGLGLAGVGILRLGSAPDVLASRQQVHIVQANIGQDEKWDIESFRENFHRYLDMTRRVISERGPGLVIWPETAIPNLIEEEITTRYLMARALDGPGVIITGGLRVDRDANGAAFAARNSLLVVDSRGAVAGTYDKAHLVPFGEYLPMRGLLGHLGLSRLAPGGIDFVPGPGARTVSVDHVPPFSPLICYEGIFTGVVVDPANRPRWLLNISNDGWFGQSTGPYQHLAQTRLRAIEEGLPLVRSTSTGVSAVFDAKGRLIDELGLGRRGVLTAPLPPPLPPTLYAQVGIAGVLVLLAFTGIAGAALSRRRL